MSDSGKQLENLNKSNSDVMPKPIKRDKGKQKSGFQNRKSKKRQQVCSEIIFRTLPEAGAVGNDLSKLVAIYEGMVRKIAKQYLESDSKEDDVLTLDLTLVPFYLTIEIIQTLVQQIPIIGPGSAIIWTFYIGRVAIDFYEGPINKDQIGEQTSSLIAGKSLSKRQTKERSDLMFAYSDHNSIIKRTFEENIRSVAEECHLPDPDTENLARDALLALDTFLRARPPVIVVTGITFTGKSALINRLFGEKKVEEGLTADTTDKVVTIRFRSGLLIYDTPGAGGLKVGLENITRAFLGLKQLENDVNNKELEPIREIPTIDAHNYNRATGQPVALRKQEEFQKTDLYLFVVNIQSGTLQRSDLLFFREVVKLRKPVIVVINKIDLVNKEAVKESMTFIQENLDRHAIAVSAATGENIQELVTTIVTSLPSECQTVLGETINKEYKKLLRHQEVGLYSLVTAVKVARLIRMKSSRDNDRQMVLLVLGLYAWIVSRYDLSVTDAKLKETGASFSDLLSIIEEKMSNAETVYSFV